MIDRSIFEKTDLTIHGIKDVSKIIPTLYSNAIFEADKIMHILSDMKIDYEKKLSERYEYFIDESDEDIFSILKNKEERTLFIRNSEEEIIEMKRNINKLENKLETIERTIKYLKDLQGNIRNIIEFEKFRAGA